MDAEPGIGVYEWQGKPLEAWIAGRRWHVRFDGREVDARTIDEALEAVLSTDQGSPAEAMRLRLAVRILTSLPKH